MAKKTDLRPVIKLRSTAGTGYTYVTTKAFLSHFGFDTLRDLPDFEALEDAGLLSKEKLLAGGIPAGLTSGERDDEVDVAEDEMLLTN